MKLKTEEQLQVIIEGLQEKKAKDLVSLNFANIENPVSKYFVVCHGDSNTHVKALADSVEEHVQKQINTKPWNKEGFENSQWIIVDYSDVVVHIFQKEFRDYYKLEELWADAQKKCYD